MIKISTKRISLLFLLSILTTFSYSQADTTKFANGADIGWLSEMESKGYVFYNDSGIQKNCMEILKEKGINSLRFRVWVNPSAHGNWCGKKDVATMAHRADSMGFRILIDFHYSDWWADPGNQTKPAAWNKLDIVGLDSAIYSHTYEILDTLKSIGVKPTWVQVGNETNNGMLWPEGTASTSMKNFASMVASGYNAVKAIDSSILVIVHLADGHKNSLYRWIFDGLKSNSANWDVIGMSVYPFWAGLPWATDNAQTLSNMNDVISRYGKKVMVVETGHPYNKAAEANNFLLDLIEKTKSVGGLGVFYWEPECYSWNSYNLGAWNPSTKRPTSALNAFLGIKDTTATQIEQTSLNSNQIRIYPNPILNNVLNIELVGIIGNSEIRVIDLNGKIWKQYTINNKNIFTISNLDLRSGLYFVQVENKQFKALKSFVLN